MFGFMLCAGAVATSCSSDPDAPMDTIPYNRVLTPLNFEAEVVTTVGTDITFKWSTIKNAESYVLELFEAVSSTDAEGAEVLSAPDYETAAPYATFEVTPDQIPYVVKDLAVDKSFYARVRGVSKSVTSSHWAYLVEPVTTSAVRPMLNPVISGRTTSAVTVSWDDAEDKLDLTSVKFELVVPVEGVAPVTRALTDAEKEACSVTVDGLAAATNYKFTLLFGKSGSRGIVTAWTRPETGDATRVESADALYQMLNGATGDLKLLLAYNGGQVYDLTAYMTANGEGLFDPMTLTCNLYLYGESSETGEKPVVKGAFKTAAGESAIHCEDISFDSANACGVTVVTGGKLSVAEFVNCDFANYTKGIYNGSDGCDVESLLFDGVYAHDINPTGSNGGDFIDIRGGSYGKIEIKNSTFYACARTFLRVSDKELKVGSIDVANCTFNQVTATATSSNNSGIFHVRHKSGEAVQATIEGAFTMKKCLFMNICNDNEAESKYWCRLTRSSNENYAPTCEGNMYYNVGHDYESVVSEECSTSFFYNLKSLQTDGATMTQALALAEGGQFLADDPCSSSIAGKMYLTNGLVSANKVGDPRWWNASEPVIVRATELETVTEPTVWDFTDKRYYGSETLEANTIIENIRIYAPAEVVMGEGISFAEAAKVDGKGLPTSSALQFRTQGVGAVEVTTLDGGVNAAVQVVVGSDRYTMLADGKTHKVVLGDLVGENDIYVLAGSAVTFTKVAWTDDLTPEATVQTLAAPKVTIDNTSFDEGTSVAVTASWGAVENAATYEVTFRGKKSEISETSFVIDAATVAALAVGEYEVSVVAKPVTTSSKYAASEAGAATFKVKKIILAGFSTVTWDFLNFDGTNLADGATWTNNKAFEKDVVWTVNPNYPMTIMNGVTVQAAGSSNGAKTADGSSFVDAVPTKRALHFTVTAPGTLKYTVKSGNTSTARPTWVAVSSNGNYKVVYTSPEAIEEATYEVDLMDLTGGETIYIFGKGNNFSKVEWTYVDENAGPKELVWDCNDSSFDAIATVLGSDGNVTATIPDLVWDGLTILTGSKTKYGTATVNDVECRYIQWGGGGSANKDRSCYFTAPASGTLTVVASNTKDAEDTSRLVAVTVNGKEYTQVGGAPTSAPTTVTFDIEVEGETPVYVYPSGNGLRFYSMKFTYVE